MGSKDDYYAEYDKKAEAVRKKNKEYLDGFEKHLRAKGLGDRTIENHVFNVEFYINKYLLYEEIREAPTGCYFVDGFLGYWFIRKAMWSSPSSIKENIASLKKFYRYFLDIELIDSDDYDELLDTIKESQDEWLKLVRDYNDPTKDNPFTLF